MQDFSLTTFQPQKLCTLEHQNPAEGETISIRSNELALQTQTK